MSKINWAGDAAHSEVTFKVKHLMITNITGKLKTFNVNVVTENDEFSNPEISFSAKAASIDTGNEQRDAHLYGPEFFDVEKYPEITFKSTGFKKAGDEYKLNGDLTIKGVTKSVALDVEFGGVQTDPWGHTKAGFTVTGKINRKDFGLNWNAPLEAGGVLVSEEVKIAAEIQLLKS